MFIQGIISCSVQLFFALRVKRLTGYTWIAAFIALMAIASGGKQLLFILATLHVAHISVKLAAWEPR
jgi:hypothetical protein